MSAAKLPEHPSGRELAAEIAAYRARTGMTVRAFAAGAGMAEQTIAWLAHSFRPKPRTVAKVRAMIARWPDGMPADAPLPEPETPAGAAGLERARARSIAPARPALTAADARAADAAAHAAARVRAARAPVARLADASPAELAQTLLVETPSDLIARVRTCWPGLWRRVVAAARARGVLPGAMLVEAIERGLGDADDDDEGEMACSA